MIPLSVERADDATAEGGPCSSVLCSITLMGQLQGVFVLLCGQTRVDLNLKLDSKPVTVAVIYKVQR